MKKVYLLLFTLFISFISFSQENENRAFVKKQNKWPSKTIPVCWENGTPTNSRQRKWVEEAVKNSWQKESTLKFDCWCPCTEKSQGIRIKIDDTWPNTKGLGIKLNGIKNGMTLNFDFENWVPIEGANKVVIMNKYSFYVKSIAMHEFGHAIGFAHEQNRKDCNFCDEKPQGDNGDWVVAACDPSSIMNYCNPVYNNGGNLSDGDVKGVRALYGFPENINRVSARKSSLSIIHNATQSLDENNFYDVNIFLFGNQEDMKEVKFVKYIFPDIYKPDETITTSDFYNQFPITISNFDEYEINAEVNMKDGRIIKLSRFLSLKEAQKKEIKPEFDFIILSEYEKIEDPIEKNIFNFHLYIDEDSPLYSYITHVEYIINDPTFDVNTLESDKEEENFGIDWDGENCLKVMVKINYTKDGGNFYKNYTYDFCKALKK